MCFIVDMCESCKKFCIAKELRATSAYAIDPAFQERIRAELLVQFKEHYGQACTTRNAPLPTCTPAPIRRDDGGRAS